MKLVSGDFLLFYPFSYKKTDIIVTAYQRIRFIMLNAFNSFFAARNLADGFSFGFGASACIFLALIPRIIPATTIKATRTCFTRSIFLSMGHCERAEMPMPEIIRRIKPSQISFEIAGIILIAAWLISGSLSDFAEITAAAVAPPTPQAMPMKCKMLKISSHAIFINIYMEKILIKLSSSKLYALITSELSIIFAILIVPKILLRIF